MGASASCDGEADLTVNASAGGRDVTGRVTACDGAAAFLVVNVGGGEHAWLELAPEDEDHHFTDVVIPEEEGEGGDGGDGVLDDRALEESLRALGRKDNTTVAEISVKIYYTREYESASGNLQGDVSWREGGGKRKDSLIKLTYYSQNGDRSAR